MITKTKMYKVHIRTTLKSKKKCGFDFLTYQIKVKHGTVRRQLYPEHRYNT